MRVSMKLGILHFAEVNLTMPAGSIARKIGMSVVRVECVI